MVGRGSGVPDAAREVDTLIVLHDHASVNRFLQDQVRLENV